MEFKRIEMLGFKSFADKTVIDINSGFTAVVGPNGCGKSNIADAIRWVLGEQSAKTLRGASMSDVIFNGTASRTKLSYCEVSLVFDNAKRDVPLDFDEIALSRKLYRNGNSEYLINGESARLKDIVDLLRDNGMGKEGYSIIGQGRIDEIILSKPEDRRSIFEEACGISKFKARKLETERKLARNHDNLLRLNDIIGELERQIKPLYKQSEDAKTFLALSDRLKYHEINGFLCQTESVATVKSQIQTRLAALNENIDAKNDDYSRASAAYDDCLAAISTIDVDTDKLRANQLKLSVDLERQSSELKLARARADGIKDKIETINKRIAEQEIRRWEINNALEKRVAQKTALGAEFRDCEARAQKADDRYLEIIGIISGGDFGSLAAPDQALVKADELTEIKSNLSSLLAERKSLAERIADIKRRLEELETETEALDREKRFIEAEVASLERKLAEAKAELERVENDDLRAENELRASQKRLSDLSLERAELTARQNMLLRVKNNLEGYAVSVRRLLGDAKRMPELSAKICGTVAQLISVQAQYRTAIDVALGGTLQNVVVPREEDAKAIIAYLKHTDYGRVTFLPVQTIKEKTLDPLTRLKLEGKRGFLGVASDFVDCDKTYSKIISSFLGRTVVASDIDSATDLAKAVNYGVRIVTLEGEIIHPFGAITGGSRKENGSGLLSGEDELADIEKRLDEIKTAFALEQTACDRLLLGKNERLEKLQKATANLRRLEIGLAEATQKYDAIGDKSKGRERDFKTLADENFAKNARLSEVDSKLKTLGELSVSVEGERELAGEESRKRRAEFERLTYERDEASRMASEIRVELTRREGELSQITAEVKRLNDELDAISRENARDEEDKSALSDQLAEIEATFDLVAPDETAESTLVNIRVALEKNEREKKNRQTELSVLDGRRRALSDEIKRLEEQRFKEQNTLDKVDINLANLETKIFESYGLDRQGCLGLLDKNYDFTVSSQEIARLKREINALGSVNVSAIESYAELKARYDDMKMQFDDVTNAENDLHKIIADLSKEMLTRFNEGFAAIQINFLKVFRELFGGGKAKLQLLEPDDGDPLKAGVDIMAEPPGKKFLSIQLLSGGERAITAIAILFSILMLRPMPFCVLDEIESALDDANTDRVANFIKRFSENTRFLVITHKKPTMEQSDEIYGITMEEKGVSKVISVKLSEAMGMAEEKRNTKA